MSSQGVEVMTNIEPDLLRKTPSDERRNFLQIVVGTGDG